MWWLCGGQHNRTLVKPSIMSDPGLLLTVNKLYTKEDQVFRFAQIGPTHL